MRTLIGIAATLLMTMVASAQRPAVPRVEGAAAMNLVVKQVPAIYRPTAKQVSPSNPPSPGPKVQAVVHLVVQIGPDGKLQNAQVTGGPAGLRQAALDNIALWTFRPFLLNGTPTLVTADYDIAFQLP